MSMTEEIVVKERVWDPFRDFHENCRIEPGKYGPRRLAEPLRWRRYRTVRKDGLIRAETDLFADGVAFAFVDWVFAVMASCGGHQFRVITKQIGNARIYEERVSREGPAARDIYVETLRVYHLGHIRGYQEGFTLPAPPTPELRFIYDQAVKWEAADAPNVHTKPMGHGFSGGEYHWRPWPLDNVRIERS
jgi:hypothetical protein